MSSRRDRRHGCLARVEPALGPKGDVHQTHEHRDFDERPDDPGDIETAVIVMRLSEGTLAILEATWLHPSGYDSRVELVADRAHLAMGLTDRTPATWLDGRAAAANEPWHGYLDRFEAAYRAELEAFLAACRGERSPATTARDGLEAVRIAVAATRAYQGRRAVPIDEVAGLPRRATA
ncbi:MAG: hypothetical protein KY392_04875 [Chloroflexi bacterium]|nr:hypothetical protein [Chloroflexota bacterium]